VFERFTERARQVVVLAQDEARLLKHNYIGTEHILLGLLREEEGLAARVLEGLDVTLEEVRGAVSQVVGQGDEVATGQIPFTPRAKKVLELSLKEALALSHNYISTEHILLGLVRENEGVGARILLDFDADPVKVRDAVLVMLGGRPAQLEPAQLDELERIRAKKDAAIDTGQFERAAQLRDRELELLQRPRAHPRVPGPPVPEERREWTSYGPRVVEHRPYGFVVGWLLFAVALGVGLLLGWLIWG
jgi:ATP-dependent Clp protease ATP-binding subunit ClpA